MKQKTVKTKELLERIFATQVLLFNRLNRIENSLSHFDPEYFDKFEGNTYRENLADIGISILGIGAALTRPIADHPASPMPPPAPVASPPPATPEAPDFDDEISQGPVIMAS